ncbi:MAG: hypothetical protein ACK58L_23095 [Planctomycetota bacterium]
MPSLLQFAYLDPGTGSLLLQALVGGEEVMMIFMKHLWKRFAGS